METRSLSISKLLGTVSIGALLSIGVCYTSLSHAAQGCGYGFHMNMNGRCVPNVPGPNATAVPGRPDCWRNGNGNLRCY